METPHGSLQHADGRCRELPRGTNDDEMMLAEMGYQQELYRGFSGFMAFAFCFTTVSVIPSISVGFSAAVALGGSAEIVWAWVVGSIFCVISGLAMAEITSVYPSAGSVYHWAGQLAPERYAPAASYVTGWCNLLGNVAGDAAFANGVATCIGYAMSIAHPGTALSNVSQVVVSLIVLAFWAAANEARTDQQGWLNNIAMAFQLIASFVIILVLMTLTPEHATWKYVFTSVYDGTGLSKDPYSISWETVILGVTNCLFAFTGYEAGAHMAEETRDARTAAPWGIVGTVLTCAVAGLIYILGMLFATPDISVFENPVKDIYVYAAGHGIGLALMIMLIVMLLFGGISSTTVTSRIAFAMARDRALPASEWLHYVNPRTQTPSRCVLTIFLLDGLLLMLPLINSTALSAFLGSCTVGFQLSYAFPILLRCTSARDSWIPGKWNLGRFSLPIAWIAVVWQLSTCLIFFAPTQYPVTAGNMNWTVVVIGAVVVVAAFNWLLVARHTFTGPKRHTDTSVIAGSITTPLA